MKERTIWNIQFDRHEKGGIKVRSSFWVLAGTDAESALRKARIHFRGLMRGNPRVVKYEVIDVHLEGAIDVF